MKRLTSLLLATVLASGIGFAEDLHKFTSADGSKSFLGTLMDVNTKAQMVKVRHQQGKIMTFKMSILSSQDQEYIQERAAILAAGQGLRIDTDMNRKSGTKAAAGTWLCEKNHYSYDVTIENTRDEAIEGVEFEYSIFIERERRDVDRSTEIITGSHTVSSFLGQSNESFTTSEVTLENWSDNPPIPSGGGGGGWCGQIDPYGSWGDPINNKQPLLAKGRGRLRDRMLGIIVRVKVNNEVVKTHATSDKLFALEPMEDEE